MTIGDIRWMSWWMPPSSFSALSSSAAEAPNSEVVFPVTILPSWSCMATAGPPVDSARWFAACTTGRSASEIPSCFMRSSSLYTSDLSASPWRFAHLVLKYLRMTSCLEASHTASSSVMHNPAILTPISVGLLYGEVPSIFSRIALSTGNISISLL